jgi:hypothetical protein
MTPIYTFRRGTLVYFDSFEGTVPCRILEAWRSGNEWRFRLQATAQRGPYQRGAIISDFPGRYVIPRGALYRSRQAYGQYRILPYIWEPEAP